MKPPAMQVTLTLQEPGEGWHFCVLRRGAILADSDGETFSNTGYALKAAIEEAHTNLHATPGGNDGATQ